MASFKFRDQKTPKTRLFTCPGSAGDPAPTAGIYELLNALGLPSGTQQILMQGERFPPAPRAWTWRRVAEMRPS